MTDFLSTDLPGTQALPGDLLYLGEDVENWDLKAGFYLLVGQVGAAVVLTVPEGDGDQLMVPAEMLARMTTRGVRPTDLGRPNARESERPE